MKGKVVLKMNTALRSRPAAFEHLGPKVSLRVIGVKDEALLRKNWSQEETIRAPAGAPM